MKLDSDFIKQILLFIENETDYVISSHALMRALGIKNRQLERKFMGHILLLADDNLLESFPAKYPFGFVYCVGGEYSIVDVNYRLTAKGYELIDILRNKEIFEKVKDLSVNNALEVSRQLLIKKAIGDRRRTYCCYNSMI